jgi:mRNA interferase RelE/StbE
LNYNVRWHEAALEDLKNLDKKTQKKIFRRVKEDLPQNPVSLGKPLKGMFKGLFRYRIGDIRIIYTLDHETETIFILKIGDRKNVYE